MVCGRPYSVAANKFRKFSKNLDSNCVPLSLVTVAGAPNRLTQPLKNALVTVSVCISFSGIASGHRVTIDDCQAVSVLVASGHDNDVNVDVFKPLAWDLNMLRAFLTCRCTLLR